MISKFLSLILMQVLVSTAFAAEIPAEFIDGHSPRALIHNCATWFSETLANARGGYHGNPVEVIQTRINRWNLGFFSNTVEKGEDGTLVFDWAVLNHGENRDINAIIDELEALEPMGVIVLRDTVRGRSRIWGGIFLLSSTGSPILAVDRHSPIFLLFHEFKHFRRWIYRRNLLLAQGLKLEDAGRRAFLAPFATPALFYAEEVAAVRSEMMALKKYDKEISNDFFTMESYPAYRTLSAYYSGKLWDQQTPSQAYQSRNEILQILREFLKVEGARFREFLNPAALGSFAERFRKFYRIEGLYRESEVFREDFDRLAGGIF